MRTLPFSVALLFLTFPQHTFAQDMPSETRGDRLVTEYFALETARLERRNLSQIKTLEDWQRNKERYRRQLLEMLGLRPLPKKTPLKPEITGTVEEEAFRVENIQFQSRPGLYVTGNLYLPKEVDGKLPAILYVCGHARVKKDGVSYGNKVAYHHHGSWFARNGYVCLTIDTLQLGEIEGIHHGTYREKMWWWNSRGYCPAGVEAWNCVRALDYLQSRPEVDGERLGVTGRSGGGAYSWWIAAIDERIKAAVPVAGITSLRNHVVDGCVEGHCDCMYMVNTYRWDFANIAALVAPRPLLISNSDKDRIFPLDGVVDVYNKTRRIYELHGKVNNIGLQITEGPHKDTQELRIHAFHWFNEHLKGEDPLIETAATKFFEPEELKVFDELPADEKNSEIHETFVPKARERDLPESAEDWAKTRMRLISQLRSKSFRGWPAKRQIPDLDVKQAFSVAKDGVRFSAYDFTSQEPFRLRLYLAHREGLTPQDLDLVVLNVLDEQSWNEFAASMRAGFPEQLADAPSAEADPQGFADAAKMFKNFKWGMAYVAPRGVGPTAFSDNERKRTHIRRRFMLLGQTLDGMRVWDARRTIEALRSVDGWKDVPLWLQGERSAAGIALYASLFEPNIQRLDLWHLPRTHRERPIFLNVMRFLDVPTTVALAATDSQVRLYQEGTDGWEFAKKVAETLDWDKKPIQVRDLSDGENEE